jgi:hypothetical protein
MEDPRGIATPTETIDPRALAAFHEEMDRRRVDLSKYNLKFYETSNAYLIVTVDKLKPPRVRWTKLTVYEVVVSREDYSVSNVWFAR